MNATTEIKTLKKKLRDSRQSFKVLSSQELRWRERYAKLAEEKNSEQCDYVLLKKQKEVLKKDLSAANSKIANDRAQTAQLNCAITGRLAVLRPQTNYYTPQHEIKPEEDTQEIRFMLWLQNQTLGPNGFGYNAAIPEPRPGVDCVVHDLGRSLEL